MSCRRRAAVAAGVTSAIGVSLLANPYLPAQLLSPWLRETFAFAGAYADPNPKMLVVRYVDSVCPSEAVHHRVVQEPNRVVVTLTRTLRPGGQPCTMPALPKLVRIPLTARLGSRAVIDGSRDTSVPVSTSPPFGS